MTSESSQPSGQSLWRQLALWAAQRGIENKFAVVLAIAAFLSGAAIWWSISTTTAFGHSATQVYLLLNLNLVTLLGLGALIARRLVRLWVQRRRGSAGSQIHTRLAALFSIVAVVPAILVATISIVLFNLGVQSWFSERVATAVNESLSVAEAYLEEHQETLRFAALSMANDLNAEAPRLSRDAGLFNSLMTRQALVRGLTEAEVISADGKVLARSALTLALQFEPIGEDRIEQASGGDIVLTTSENGDRVRALYRLERFVDAYLVIGRLVEAKVIDAVERTQGAVVEYQQLEGRRTAFQFTFTLFYIAVSILVLLIAVWIGLVFADTLVTPLSGLIIAAEKVRAGDLTVRVPERPTLDEINGLSRSFNRMTSQLESQQRDLIEANRQLDLRRRFTETVLAGVSAGVMGLDEQGRINLPNRSAVALLDMPMEEVIGRPIEEVAPEMAPLLEQIRNRPGRLVQEQVKIRRAGEARTLLVRVAAERLDGEIRGYVVTFDDISELLSAQRKAAWADVARRIAHEIKNPLTPIQLSAERLKRKYLKQITSDPETFVTCTDTIVRQVGDIGRMVDEFSAFARMPSPVMKPIDIARVVEEAIFLQRNAHPKVRFSARIPAERPAVPCDQRQVSQAVTNLLQNAIDAIDGREQEGDTPLPAGTVAVQMSFSREEATITVEDNGKGLPAADRDSLTEPYVTTRTKGTGLGLAIVKKIMEDHAGRLMLGDRPGGGARVSLVFPLGTVEASAAGKAREPDQAKSMRERVTHGS